MPTITDLIMTAIDAGVPTKVARFLGAQFERTLDLDRNFKNMNPETIRSEISKVESELKRVKLYKQAVPFTIRERIQACRLILDAAFKRSVAAARLKQN